MNTISHLWHSSRGCCLFMAILLLLIVLGSCAVLGFGLARLTEAAGATGLDVMLIVDQSGSLWELGGIGTDPAMMRMEAARLLSTYLGVDGPLPDYRLGVVYFGTTPELVMPLTSLTKDHGGREAVLAALGQPPELMGWTDVNAALALAYQELYQGERAVPDHAKAVVLFTDGRPQTAANSTPASDDAYLADLRQWVRRFSAEGATLATVLLVNPVTDHDSQMTAVYRPLWRDLAASGASVRFYDVQAGEDLLDVYHDLAVQLQRGETQGAILDDIVDGQAQATITIPPGWRQATLVMRRSNPALSVLILRPNGRPVQAADPDIRRRGDGRQIEIWSIDRPEPGQWSLQIDGQGALTAWLDYRPLPPTPTPTIAPSPSATSSPSQTTTIPVPVRASAVVTALPAPTISAPLLTASVDETEPTTAAPPWGWIAFAVVAVVTGGSLGLVLLRRQSPALEGKLRMVQAPEGEPAGRSWDFGQSRRSKVIVGTSRENDIMLARDPELLPRTAIIRAERGADGETIPVLSDLSGRQLAQVKGQPAGSRQMLQDGALIQIGAYQLRYENLTLRRQAKSWRPPSNRSTPGRSS